MRPATTDRFAGEARPQARRLSMILSEIANDERRDRVSIGDLCDAFHDRAFGALMLIFAAPNVIPVPVPAVSVATGVPLVFLALQLMLGRPAPWLPAWVRGRTFRRADFAVMVGRVDPWLARIERCLRPRLDLLVRPPAEWVVGGGILLLSLLLFVPIPFGQMLPGLAISAAALALLERDGIVMIIGGLVGLASLALAAGILYGIVEAALFVLAVTLES